MKKTFDETILSAYLDGELDAATMNEVDSFLGTDPQAAGYILDTVRTSARLKAGMNAILQEEIPQRLLDTLSPQQAARSRRKPLMRSIIRMAAFVILGIVGFGIGTLMERNTGGHYPAVIAPLPARYSEVVDAALEFNLSGKPREWKAPRGSIALKVTPVKTYRDKAGVYYREYRLEVATGTRRSQINGLAYRTAKGNWTTKVMYF
jgi:hypothetical protein